MIVANTRQRMTRNDAQLAAHLLARGSARELDRLEEALTNDGLDAVLDDPRLPAAILDLPQGARASFPLFVYAMVRHALLEAGENERVVADYVSSVILEFGLGGRAHRISDADDQTYSHLSDICQDLDDPNGNRAFQVQTHLGNYALWLSGLFPDYIENRRWRRGGPSIDFFDEMGSRGFQLASDNRVASQYGLNGLFATAAKDFPTLRIALNRVSDSLFFPQVWTPERLMRQARDEARWRFS